MLFARAERNLLKATEHVYYTHTQHRVCVCIVELVYTLELIRLA